MTEAHIAGHATHFLRRLDRVLDEQVETALALYNDAELLREVLARAAVPDGSERVALALERTEAPPYVVVTRQGKFVTCLGAGMRPSAGTHVVARERLEVAAAHVERMRERLARVRALEGRRGEASQHWDRLCRAGAGMAREDFEQLERWEPLLGRSFVAAAIGAEREIITSFEYLRTRRLDKLSHADEAHLESWYYAFWAWAHVLTLLHVGDVRERMRELQAEQREGQDVRWALSAMAMRFAIVGPSIRGLWAVARHGREVLPAIKRMPKTVTLAERVPRELPLAVVGHVSQKARAEVLAALGPVELAGLAGDEREWRAKIRVRLVEDLRAGEAAIPRAEADLRESLWMSIQASKAELPERAMKPEELPLELGLGLLAAQSVSWRKRTGLAVTMAETIPLLVRLPAAGLFLPRHWGKAVGKEYATEDAWELVDDIALAFGKARTEAVRSTKVAGRNDPCPCGSGNKYKQCCLRAG